MTCCLVPQRKGLSCTSPAAPNQKLQHKSEREDEDRRGKPCQAGRTAFAQEISHIGTQTLLFALQVQAVGGRCCEIELVEHAHKACHPPRICQRCVKRNREELDGSKK